MNTQDVLSLLVTQSRPCLADLKSKLETQFKKQQNFENLKTFVSALNIQDFQTKVEEQEQIADKEELYSLLSSFLIVLKEELDFYSQNLKGSIF